MTALFKFGLFQRRVQGLRCDKKIYVYGKVQYEEDEEEYEYKKNEKKKKKEEEELKEEGAE